VSSQHWWQAHTAQCGGVLYIRYSNSCGHALDSGWRTGLAPSSVAVLPAAGPAPRPPPHPPGPDSLRGGEVEGRGCRRAMGLLGALKGSGCGPADASRLLDRCGLSPPPPPPAAAPELSPPLWSEPLARPPVPRALPGWAHVTEPVMRSISAVLTGSTASSSRPRYAL
jgi:hypothetical protein